MKHEITLERVNVGGLHLFDFPLYKIFTTSCELEKIKSEVTKNCR